MTLRGPSPIPSAPPPRQRGVALLTALLVVALATIAAVAMTSRQHMDIRRTTAVFTHDQAHQLSLAAEAYALRLLGRGEDRELPWEGCLSPPIPATLEGAGITVWLEDLHCRFNLNALGSGDEAWQAAFVRLLEEILRQDPEADLDPEGLARAVRDWLDPETDDPDYRAMDPPRLSANRPMVSPSELRLVKGVDNAAWRALAPYVTALPGADTPLRLEHAPDPLRNALAGLDQDDSEGGEAPPARYYRLQVRTEIAGHRFFLCSILDTGAQEVILREQVACGP
ncbi:type II secretion system minor pseudopilin GspK [Ectothiorhodospira mobilis]|uniref:type II secretion system minor pseudopilin GspK n=1 Tax=Ectothiorhodospira mobilis TaxID=195064 RepID=UPI001905D1F2|nr:type II secretion system minor pseudopilin GspK [Ectothiorhodospira mobilis]MBK1691693.1 general secretion pathway protein GspK [Ectothiorhodospira mobilis]